MSYATIRDVLFALDLTDSELRDWLTTEPELPDDRSELRAPAQPARLTGPSALYVRGAGRRRPW